MSVTSPNSAEIGIETESSAFMERVKPATTLWDYIEKPGFQPRPLQVAIVGAGFSGICLAIKIMKAQKEGTLGPVEFVLYDKDTDYGGTWHANRYPGCQCDVPSHAYHFSFAPYSDWPHFYSSGADINIYAHLLAQRYGVEPFIHLRHTLRSAVFDEQEGKWNLAIENSEGQLIHSKVDVYVPATGVLSQVNRPNIPGLDSFTKNAVIHTAEWPENLDWKSLFKDENVAVVGVGSSGLQTVGAIAPHCKSLTVFARSKFWLSPPFLDVAFKDREWKKGNFAYSEEEKEQFRRDPETLFKHDHRLSGDVEHFYDVFWKGSDAQKKMKDALHTKMVKELDPSLLEKLLPEWDVWCRRLTPSEAFVEAVRMPHVEVVTDHIQNVDATGITTVSGEIKKIDRIILATGFDTSFRPRYELLGKNSVSLSEVWSHRAKAYMSVAVAGFPNLFFMCGPGTIFANGSVVPGIEANADYIIQALEKLQKQDLKFMEVDQDVQDEYIEQQEAVMKNLVFTGPCPSWYKNGQTDAYPDAIYAGSTLSFLELLSKPRWEDWKFTSRYRNRFSFLGNGRGTVETTGGDRAYYIKFEDHINPLKRSDLK